MLDAVHARNRAARPGGMTPAEAEEFFALLLAGSLPAVDGAALLVDLETRGATATELATLVRLLLARAAPAPAAGRCFDLCGTGGSGLARFNVSTTSAFVLAACGVPVAKHGNRGSARPNGSFDLLDALAVPFSLAPSAHERLLRETGVCFLFARQMHPGVAAVAPYRKLAAQQVKRTVFNLAGPLANPCRPARQMIGATDERTARVLADALGQLGGERAIVVRGHPGIDEVSVTGTTHLWDIAGGRVHHRVIDPGDRWHGLEHAALPGGEAEANAATFHRLLAGEETGALFDMVLANAGAAIDCWNGAPVLGGDGRERARAAITSGAALASFEKHRSLARELAGLDAR